MVEEDVVLAGYRERVERAMVEERDCKWNVYLDKQQAQVEWEKVFKRQKDYMSEEEVKQIMVAFFRGSDLVYYDRK